MVTHAYTTDADRRRSSRAMLLGDDVDVAARYVEAGALLLRLVASRMGKGEPGLDASAPLLLDFIADGMLDRAEILHCAVEAVADRPEEKA